MAYSPSTDNYTLGKGVLYFDKKNLSLNSYEGFRDLGNAPSVSLSITLETLDHFSSRSGLKAKDKKVITQVSPTIQFTLDESSIDNVALLYMCEKQEINQAASDDMIELLSGVKKGRVYELDKKKIGIWAISYDSIKESFTIGLPVTGAKSGATGTIVEILEDGPSGSLYLQNIEGDFQKDEEITDISSGSATTTTDLSFVTTSVSVADTDNPDTFYTVGFDFTLNREEGMLIIPYDSSIPDDSNLTIKYGCEDCSYTFLNGLKQTQIEGRLKFVSDNAVGNNMTLDIWRVALIPDGENALIGDSWSTLSFKGEVLKDELNHPESPYLNITM